MPLLQYASFYGFAFLYEFSFAVRVLFLRYFSSRLMYVDLDGLGGLDERVKVMCGF